MKKAFIFPGQASQYVGMGKDLYDHFPVAKVMYDEANDLLGINLRNICFEGPEYELKQTNITQPAIFVHSVIISRLLELAGCIPDGVAGHSLGEYSALAAAKSMEFGKALNLVKKRGELMFKAGKDKPGTMAAIIGMEPEQIRDICVQASAIGIVQPANYNSPGQVVISGEIKAVYKAMELAKQSGAKKALELVVSGAFHSPLMQDAAYGLKEALDNTEIKDINIPLYSNVNAVSAMEGKEIRNLLFQQLTQPVRWQETMENMIKDGFTQFYEVGPGNVLKALLKRINREVNCSEIGTVEQINQLEKM
jgi:[acyl-carrier-protein] S-malonyltransferase